MLASRSWVKVAEFNTPNAQLPGLLVTTNRPARTYGREAVKSKMMSTNNGYKYYVNGPSAFILIQNESWYPWNTTACRHANKNSTHRSDSRQVHVECQRLASQQDAWSHQLRGRLQALVHRLDRWHNLPHDAITYAWNIDYAQNTKQTLAIYSQHDTGLPASVRRSPDNIFRDRRTDGRTSEQFLKSGLWNLLRDLKTR